MTSAVLQTIDWSRPWLVPFKPAGRLIDASAENWRDALNTAADAMDLRNHCNLPVRFVSQSDLPPHIAYESFIGATGCVPTRNNLHDFFNALVWLTFPRIKRQLNALQVAEIAKCSEVRNGASVVVPRGKLRDAATIFDENAALLITTDREWVDALRAHRWHEALVVRRDDFGRSVSVAVFGHALLEKLVAPYKAITAHGWIVIVEPDFFLQSQREQRDWIDVVVARQLAGSLTTGDFTPLPVLGVPGWCTGQDAEYYADRNVFRPKRSPVAVSTVTKNTKPEK